MTRPAGRRARCIGFAVAWCVLIVAQHCSTWPRYPDVALLTMMAMTALWANHVALAPVADARGIARVAGAALIELVLATLWTLVLMIPIAILLPHYYCDNGRVRAGEVLNTAAPQRFEIADRARAAGTLAGAGRGLAVPLTERVRWSMVTDDGVIVVASNEPHAVFVLRPTLVGGKVDWTCVGASEGRIPASCMLDANIPPAREMP